MDKVADEIQTEHKLKKTETADKSAPKIEEGTHFIHLYYDLVNFVGTHVKKVDREGLKTEIQGEHKLKRAETTDKSAPKIESTFPATLTKHC